jgi:hypothetical protein
VKLLSDPIRGRGDTPILFGPVRRPLPIAVAGDHASDDSIAEEGSAGVATIGNGRRNATSSQFGRVDWIVSVPFRFRSYMSVPPTVFAPYPTASHVAPRAAAVAPT